MCIKLCINLVSLVPLVLPLYLLSYLWHLEHPKPLSNYAYREEILVSKRQDKSIIENIKAIKLQSQSLKWCLKLCLILRSFPHILNDIYVFDRQSQIITVLWLYSIYFIKGISVHELHQNGHDHFHMYASHFTMSYPRNKEQMMQFKEQPYLYPEVVCTRMIRDLFSIIGRNCLLSASNNKWRWNWSWNRSRDIQHRYNIVLLYQNPALAIYLEFIKDQGLYHW